MSDIVINPLDIGHAVLTVDLVGIAMLFNACK